jgi:hypothetical protein
MRKAVAARFTTFRVPRRSTLPPLLALWGHNPNQDAKKGPRSAALPSENGVAVWQETQNVPWSLADIGHEIHHVDLVSR